MFSSSSKEPANLSNGIFDIINRNKFLIAATTIVISILVGVYSFFVYVPKYSSSASVMVKDSALTAKFLTNDQYTTTTAQSSNPVLNTMELLKSELIPEYLWQDLISKSKQAQEEAGVSSLAEWKKYFGDGKRFIKAKNVPGTDVIAMGFQWPSPDIAQKGLRSVLFGFQQASLQQNQSEHHQRYLYLSEQGKELRTQLGEIRQAVAVFKKSHNIYSLDSALSNYEQNRSAIANSSKIASAEAQNYLNQLNAYQKTLGMNSQKAVSAVAVGRSTTLSQLYAKLYELTGEKTALQARYTDEHPKVKELISQVAQTKNDIEAELARNGVSAPSADIAEKIAKENAERKTAPANTAIGDETRSNAVRDMLEAEARYKGLQAQSAGLKRALSEMDSQMQGIPKAEATLATMRQEEESLSSALEILDEKTLESRMREAQTLSNVFVLAPPSLPSAPAFPSKIQLAVIGIFFGLAAGVGLAYVKASLLSPTVRRRDDRSSMVIPLEELIAAEHHYNMTPDRDASVSYMGR
ncbi:MAG: Wzz/FepE/Etk N-terminal domain-containing protein [Vampirovibrionales bacterium]|nr:Wzz/FepE/Etk N-terminal domain-containing protein [Vampirovibrionales bacterium]